jgi:hypothetical protein
MGVRGTEFVLAVDQGQSKLLTIDGEVFARPVEKQEADLFEHASEAFIKQDETQLVQQVNDLRAIEIPKEINLQRGQKIERVESPLAQQTEFVSQAVQLDDLKEAEEIGENIEQLVQDKRQKDLDSLTDEKSKPTPEAKSFLARVGVGGLGISHPSIEASEGGLSFSFDYLLNPYTFASLEIARGDWTLDDINSSSGLGPGDFEIKTKNSSRYLIGIGGRWPFTTNFSAAAALGYVGERHLAIQHSDQIHMDYRIQPSVLIRFEVSHQIWDDWQVFLSFAGGKGKAKLHSSGPGNRGPAESTLDLDQSYGRIGIGRFFGYPSPQ